MPAYATMDDIIALYGADLLDRVADPQNTGRADPAIVAAALAEASGIINSYLSMRYILPLNSVPDFLKTECIDIAMYRMAVSEDVLTTQIERRYDHAISHLKEISKGIAGLGFEGTSPQAQTDDA